MGGSHLIRRGLAGRTSPQSTPRNGTAGSVAAATETPGQKFDLVTGLKCNNSAWMETTSDTFKLKIPEFVQLSFPLRCLPIMSKSVQISESEWGSSPPKRKKYISAMAPKVANMHLTGKTCEYKAKQYYKVKGTFGYGMTLANSLKAKCPSTQVKHAARSANASQFNIFT